MLFWNLQVVMGIEQTFVFGLSSVKKKKKNKLVSVWVNAGSENGSSHGGAMRTWVVA
jgi:hypothetical protein